MSATIGAGIAYTSGPPEFTTGFSRVRVTRSFVLCVCFKDRCLSICPFSIGYCVICSSSIYEFLYGTFNLFLKGNNNLVIFK
jgi:hypothetical protein